MNAWTGNPSTLPVCVTGRVDGCAVHAYNHLVIYSTAFTIDSMTFFASPNTIIVFG